MITQLAQTSLKTSNHMPTLVFISPCIPDPKGVGWEQRAYSFLLAYSKICHITLWFQATHDNRNIKRLAPALDIIEAAFAFDERFLFQDHALLNNLTAAIQNANTLHVFRLASLLERIQHHRVIWDFDELPYPLRAPERRVRHPDVSSEDVSKIYRIYKSCWQRSKVVIASSPVEHHPQLGQPIVVPNVTDAGPIRTTLSEPKNILFVGNLNKIENLLGIKFFVENCMPHLMPEASLIIVGRRPKASKTSAFLRSVIAIPNIRVFYDVDDCIPFYHTARLVIVPLQDGAGTKLKLLEALGQQCPVVTTTKGIEGLPIIDGKDALVRDDPRGFADACNALLSDEALATTIATNGYHFVKDNYSQQQVDKLLQAIYNQSQ